MGSRGCPSASVKPVGALTRRQLRPRTLARPRLALPCRTGRSPPRTQGASLRMRARPCLRNAEPAAVLVVELEYVRLPTLERDDARLCGPLGKAHARAAAVRTLQPAKPDRPVCQAAQCHSHHHAHQQRTMQRARRCRAPGHQHGIVYSPASRRASRGACGLTPQPLWCAQGRDLR